MSNHRWSGWPGAWCLDCGCGDPIEDAVGDPAFDAYEGKWDSPEDEDSWRARNRTGLAACPRPGSNVLTLYVPPEEPSAGEAEMKP